VTYRRLLDRYRTPTAALDALPHFARAVGRTAPAIMSLADAERELQRTYDRGGRMVFLGD
jgi:DNA processing protein